MAIDFNKYKTKEPKPMPVFLLLDVSGSMDGTKIENLNEAVREMLESFPGKDGEANVKVSIITFGSKVKSLFAGEMLPAKKALARWNDLDANGMTPMGLALQMAKDMIEDRDIVPSRSYRPLVVLVSDGQPNDEWEQPLQAFINDGRSKKCDRMAMAIGRDADRNVLNRFIAGTTNSLFEAHQGADIHNFFKQVTMSVSATTQEFSTPQGSATPQTPPQGASSHAEEVSSSQKATSQKTTPNGNSNNNDDDDDF